MGVRLVLEWGFSRHPLRTHAEASRGDLRVVSENERLVEDLRAVQVPVVHNDPSEAEVLRELADSADVILIAATEPGRNLEIAATAKRVYPRAKLIAFAGMGAEHDTLRRLRQLSDRIIEDAPVVRDSVLDIAHSATAIRARRVRSVLESIDDELAVFMHDNPDPDAIASAVALVRMADALGNPAQAYYYGEITHQSNRAFVNLLELGIESLDPGEVPEDAGGIALVDHSLPGVNDSLPSDTPIDLVFDHHTPGGPVEARYVDIRESAGATSSIMIEYLRQIEVATDAQLATALLYGIRTDTKDFSRHVTPLDFDAAGFVWSRADHAILERIENPSISHETITTIAEAISERKVRDNVLAGCVGRVSDRDAIAQAADLLLQMEGIDIVLVYGFKEGILFASARARSPSIPLDLSTVMRDAFGQIGTAGGHEEMAGAQIPLGLLGTMIDDEEGTDRISVIRDVIDERFFESVSTNLSRTVREGSARRGHALDEERF